MRSRHRREMDPAYMWDLTAIFKSDDAWKAAYDEAEREVRSLDALPGTLQYSEEKLKQGLDAIFTAREHVERVYGYAFLLKSADNSDPRYQEMEARTMTLMVALETATAFVEPEILSIPVEILEIWLKQDAFGTYRHMIDDIARRRSHTLDAKGERLLAMLGDVAQTPGTTFEMFESVDMRFPPIHNEKGETVELTHGGFTMYRESSDPAVRREAFEVYFNGYASYIQTLASIYGGSVKMDCFMAQARGFAGACEAALFDNNVPLSLYDGLIEAVHSALPSMRRYLELRRQALGLDELHLYDLYAPMVEDVEYSMTYETAQTLVMAALKPLGEAYQALLERAFKERWIDVYENQGKSTGAFSMGVYGAHPYVLMNFTGKLDDAFTLAHELGHSMHSYFSDSSQDYVNHDYRIFVAEVASTVNEVLLTRYLLDREEDVKRRACILNHFLEGFRTTVFRQTLFAEFERKAHELYQQGTPLTAQTLNNVYHDLNALYYEGAVIDDFADVEWARIPHFYRAFYVYQYATGYSSAVAIASNILKTGKADDYLKFLSTGGSDYPIEELKLAGVDLTRPQAVAQAMEVFRQVLDDLKGILTDRAGA